MMILLYWLCNSEKFAVSYIYRPMIENCYFLNIFIMNIMIIMITMIIITQSLSQAPN